jgi:hypothetical protein
MEELTITFGMYGILVSYVLLAVATLAFVGFELYQLATNIKDSKGQLAGAAALIIILGLGWVLGSGDFYFQGIEAFEMTPTSIRLVDMGLIGTYVLLAIAIIGLVADIVLSSVKR